MDESDSPVRSSIEEKKSYLKWLIPLIIMVVLIACGIFVWSGSVFGKDLPETGKGEKPAYLLLETLPPNAIPTTIGTAAPAIPSQTAANLTAVQAEPVCGGPDHLVILALGVDENAQTDVLRLVRADFIEQKVTVLSIPRDFWLPISGLGEYGVSDGRINAAYGYGEHYTGRGTGVGVLATTIDDNFGVEIDHYGLVYLTNFATLIDRIGGVDIVLEQPVDGTASDLPYFPAGTNHLTGQKALEFSRIRESDTDDFRIDRQTMVVKEALKKMRDTLSVTELVKLAGQFMLEQSVSTDIPMNTIYSLACLGKGLDGDNILYLNIPPDLYTATTTNLGGNIRIPSPEAAAYIQSVMNGIIPPSEDSQSN